MPSIWKFLDENNDRVFRIGTGEFTDSLALDPIYGWSKYLIPEFSQRDHILLELKTKSTNVKGLLRIRERKNVVISWSLNSPHVWEMEEGGTPDMESRLRAASLCQAEGYVIGLHFDPIFEYPGCKEDYRRTVELLSRYLDPRGIIWISLGTIRFMPGLMEDLREKGKKSLIFQQEYALGLDGKLRVFKPIRMELYKSIAEELKSWYKDLGIYLCMESRDVWEYSLGWGPAGSLAVSDYLDDRKRLFFGGT